MRNLGDIWRKRLWLWLSPLIFFAANLTAWSYYQLSDYGDQVNRMEQSLESRRKEDAKLGAEAARQAELVERAATNRRRIEALYSDRFATQSERLTAVIAEVRDLARKAGLEPSAVTYPEQLLEDYGLERKDFVFSVTGSYADLRKLINSLELTETFISLDEVGLSQDSGAGNRLRITLRLSTLFASEKAAAAEETVEERSKA